MNEIRLAGTVTDEPRFLYEFYGEKFYGIFIESRRISETVDTLSCVVPEILAEGIKAGNKIKVFGEVRTRNEHIEGKTKLLIYVFVKEILEYKGYDVNFVDLVGFICKDPLFRVTPMGRTVSDLLIASNRERVVNSDYIPCIAWGRNARRVANMSVGAKLNLIGRIQSREYNKKLDDGTQETRIAYEVSVSRIDVVEREDNNNESRSKENL